jgi:hypothetical protein
MYPVTYAAAYEEQRSRLHTFFRFLTIIPAAIVLWFMALPLVVTLPLTWIVLLVTGRYIPGLYAYHAGLLRVATRVGAYASLVTDRFPSFGLDDDPSQPVRVLIAPPQPGYSRLLVFFRVLLYVPVYVIAYALMIISGLASFAAWFVIVVTGRQLAGLQGAINLGHAYQTRAYGYALLLTDRWPPLDEIAFELEPGPGPGAGANAMTPSSTGALPSS